MSNHKKITSIAFTGAAATAMTGLAAAPALAVASWHIKNGGVGYHGIFKAKGPISGKDTTNGAAFKCMPAVVSGSLPTSHTTSNKLGHVKKSARWTCSAGTFKFKLHLKTSPVLSFSAYRSGVATGRLLGVSFSVSGSGLFSRCKATIAGTSIPFKYTNANHSFDINSGAVATLTVKSTRSCAGAIATGDGETVHGIFHVFSPTALTFSHA